MGNQDSGMVHALFYSLVLSSIINKLNPRIFLHFLINATHDIRQGKVDINTLLPHSIDHNVPNQFAQQQINYAKIILNST